MFIGLSKKPCDCKPKIVAPLTDIVYMGRQDALTAYPSHANPFAVELDLESSHRIIVPRHYVALSNHQATSIFKPIHHQSRGMIL